MSAIQDLIVKYRENQSKELASAIISKIQTEESIWAAVSEVSRNYYLGNEEGKAAIYLFSDEEYANAFIKRIKEEYGIEMSIFENKKELRMQFFADVYRSGFDTVVVDNGQTYVRMSLFDIIKKPDPSKQPKESRFIVNPSLVRSANWFHQENARGRDTTAVWAALFTEIYKGEYIIPANTTNVKMEVLGKEFIVDKESEVKFPLLKTPKGETYFPFFTDWNEFRKFDMKEQFSTLAAKFDDMKKMIQNVDGIVINPYGSNIMISKEILARIEEAGKGASGKTKQVRVGIPKERPIEIERKVTACLEEILGVRSASLRLSECEGVRKFLICIDCDDFEEAAEKLKDVKFENKTPVEYISTDSPIAKAAFKDAEPFFSR